MGFSLDAPPRFQKETFFTHLSFSWSFWDLESRDCSCVKCVCEKTPPVKSPRCFSG